jgi:hypothetical protein
MPLFLRGPGDDESMIPKLGGGDQGRYERIEATLYEEISV